MRKIIVKYFGLDYICKVFGYTFNFTRSATVIFPLFVGNSLLVLKYGFQIWQIVPAFLLLLSLFLGFIYFRIKPIKWQEMDLEQIFQYGSALKSRVVLSEDVNDTEFILADLRASRYVKEYINNKRFYKPYLAIFHPAVMVGVSVAFTIIILY